MHDSEIEALEQAIPAVFPVVERKGILAHWSALPQSESAPVLATWDVTTTAGKNRLAIAITAPAESLWDMCENGNFKFEVDDIVVTFDEYESEERPGEIISGPVLTLFSPRGRYRTGSQPAFRALQRIAASIGQPPWNPPVQCEALRRGSRNRKIYLHIQYLGRIDL
jgi:hypothetical protein